MRVLEMRGHLLFSDRRTRATVDGLLDGLGRNDALADFWIGILDQLPRDDIAARSVRLRLLRLRSRWRLGFAAVSTLPWTLPRAF